MAFVYGNTGTTCYSSCAVSGKMWPQGAQYMPISLGITGSVLGRSYMYLTSIDLGHICTFGNRVINVLDNGFTLNRWQTIIWTSDDFIYMSSILYYVLYQLTEAEWCIYASVKWAIIGSGNGRSLICCQAITWTNVSLLSLALLGTNFSEIQIGILPFSLKKTHLKRLSAKMVAILSKGKWDKTFYWILETVSSSIWLDILVEEETASM